MSSSDNATKTIQGSSSHLTAQPYSEGHHSILEEIEHDIDNIGELIASPAPGQDLIPSPKKEGLMKTFLNKLTDIKDYMKNIFKKPFQTSNDVDKAQE